MLNNIEIEIIPYNNTFQNNVVELILNIQQNEFLIPVTIDDQPDLKNITDYYQKNRNNFWIAVHKNKLIGTIAFIDYEEKKGAIRKMFVHKDYRGKPFGIAQLLLNTLLGYAKSMKFELISLGTVEKLIGAQKFYEKNNFIKITANQLDEKFPRMSVDNVFYQIEINQ